MSSFSSCSPVHNEQHQHTRDITRSGESTRQPPFNLLCQTFAAGPVARAAQSRPNGRQRLRRKVRSMTLSSFTNQKKTNNIQYRWRGMNKKRRQNDEARVTWSRACAFASWSCRPCSRVALSDLIHLHRRFYFLCPLLSSLAGWVGGMYALLCGSSNRIGPLVVE